MESSSSSSFYDNNGYLPAFKVLTEEQATGLRSKFNKMEEEIGKDEAAYSLHNHHMKERWVMELASHPNLLKTLQLILGQDVFLLDSRFICKYPSEDDGKPAKYVAWHQDMKYWGIDGHVVSAWLAVDDADVGNGCMCVIPATHNDGVLEHRRAVLPGNLLSNDQEIPGHLYDASNSIPVPVKAGHTSLHHGHLVHGSEPNMSDRRRCGFVIRYVGASGKPVEDPERPRKFPATVLLSGENSHQNFVDHAPEWYREGREAGEASTVGA